MAKLVAKTKLALSFANVHLMKAKLWVKYLPKNVWLFVHVLKTKYEPNRLCYRRRGE